MQKSEVLLHYIESLDVGSRISVRQMAMHQHVSAGTAYRAIKAAKDRGLVATIDRVGTVRTDPRPRSTGTSLTFADLVRIINGTVLGGNAGLDKPLEKFVIGAMKNSAMEHYISRNSLLIVGNREEAQMLALRSGAAVLITGGFDSTKEVTQQANAAALPVITTSYDTFTVATMINRALSDQAIRRDILTVASLYTPLADASYLVVPATIADYMAMNEASGHAELPVVSASGRVLGVATPATVLGKRPGSMIERGMEKHPAVVKTAESVATVNHLMQARGINLVPVVDDAGQLLGVLTKATVLAQLQDVPVQERLPDTIADQLSAALHAQDVADSELNACYTVATAPMMTNKYGALNVGVLSGLITSAASKFLRGQGRQNVLVDKLDLTTVRPIQLTAHVEIKLRVLEINRRNAIFDVDIDADKQVAAKALLTCQLLERN
ncbi:DRTGG domain-containing protein [Lacticaseibacillus zhaodongensis]|uniref:DRTGG domain-containing protein n=1 Tax=Lacticaseibacillus zhaodongensis TaxID=2668065 RepID=UPI001E2D97FE|nr:DRTGG domain-containing protein [Lacticaseibacillus zhaodongensis]